MEAIPEFESEEGSEFESEDGSEYTTDDEGSSTNHSSSSLGTPIRSVRSGSQASGSRASSPRLDPQDEHFPSDMFTSDFDFVIEAPDFPFGLADDDDDDDNENSRQDSGRDSLSTDAAQGGSPMADRDEAFARLSPKAKFVPFLPEPDGNGRFEV